MGGEKKGGAKMIGNSPGRKDRVVKVPWDELFR